MQSQTEDAKKPLEKKWNWKKALVEKCRNIVALYFILSILTVIGFAAGIKYEVFQSHSFVVVNQVRAASQPKDEEVTVAKRDLVDEIFLKESSRGKKNYSKCEAKGMYNRYGFGIPGDGTYLCFEKDMDTVAVAGWVAHKKALGYTDNQLLCGYNSGKFTDTCGYIQ